MMIGEPISGLPEILMPQECTPRRIADLLDSTKWANTLSLKEVEALSRYLHVCLAEKGKVIVCEGSHEAYLCLLVDGAVEVLKKEPDTPRWFGK